MGQHKKLVNYFGEHYPAELENYLEFFAKAMMYACNENRVTIYEMSYGREFAPDDTVYAARKLTASGEDFPCWFLTLDGSNRKRFVEAVMHYMRRGSLA